MWSGLTDSPFALALHAGTAVAAVLAFGLLLARRFWPARVAAAAQVGFIVMGWAGAALIIPSLLFLLRVFQSPPAEATRK